jgi:hypothetical protein
VAHRSVSAGGPWIVAAMSDNEKMKLCMLGVLAIALSIMVIVYLPVWYR